MSVMHRRLELSKMANAGLKMHPKIKICHQVWSKFG
jgi:hypothetical protein